MEKFIARVETLIRGKFTTADRFRALLTQALAMHSR
jgi:hypothetical protein